MLKMLVKFIELSLAAAYRQCRSDCEFYVLGTCF